MPSYKGKINHTKITTQSEQMIARGGNRLDHQTCIDSILMAAETYIYDRSKHEQNSQDIHADHGQGGKIGPRRALATLCSFTTSQNTKPLFRNVTTIKNGPEP